MKVGSVTSTPSSPSAKAAPAASGGFSVGAPAPAAASTGVRAAGPVASLDALLALQIAEGPLEKKRRAVKRGERLLDLLGEVKIGLLDGVMPRASLERLSRAVREERDSVEDPALQGVLDEIETRAAVELAKLHRATVAP